jgi:AmmeMemoRadiSam system protein B/AmmeMemoRadiSam system protein A
MPVPHPERLDLPDGQTAQLLRQAAAMVRAAVLGEGFAPLPDDLGAMLVSGTFVSLKRGKHLRSCCGGMQGQPAPLADVLPDAVQRAVYEDPRFPPISPCELPFLDIELWLLFNPQRVHERGEDRIAAVVTGGKHGLVVRYGEHRGLLLPGVASEHGWDSLTFLEHVCQKAGLHASRWRDDETVLMTFEGVSCRDRLCEETIETPRFLPPEHVAAYADFCRQNLHALLFGGTPRYAAPGLPDGMVSGLLFSLENGETVRGERPWQWSKLDLQRGMSLQASLFQLTQTAAQSLGRLGVSEAELARLNLSVLYDPAMHGAVADPDLRGIAPGRRAVVVLERGRCGLAHDVEATPEALLAAAANEAQVRDPAVASVFSLAVDAVAPRVVHSVRPRAVAGNSLRPPAVAGAFYPADAEALQRLVDELLEAARPEPDAKGANCVAAMVPHAGLRYSGKVAAQVFQRLTIPSTVIVIGPKHTPYGMDWAIAPQREWLIPGARLAADADLARRIADAIPGMELDAAAHQHEHGIEVELPFIARLAPQTRVVGIALGATTLDDCRAIAMGLATVVESVSEPPLLLISSDMNHFANDAETRRLDELALQCLDRLDPEALFTTCKQRHITMCGVVPAVIILETLRRLGRLHRAERVAYATSADATGDKSRVVGYAGMVFG